jgi:hypothetical protein
VETCDPLGYQIRERWWDGKVASRAQTMKRKLA